MNNNIYKETINEIKLEGIREYKEKVLEMIRVVEEKYKEDPKNVPRPDLKSAVAILSVIESKMEKEFG